MRTIKQLLMMVALLLCSVTSNAYDFEVNGIYYNIISTSDLTVEVTNGDNKYSGAVIIPSTITYKAKTLSVISIGHSAFKDCYGLISCVIGNNVTNIKQYAFRGCSNLTSVTIGENVANIENAAFYDCTGLEEVHISNLSAWCNIDFDTHAPGPHAEKLYLNGELVTDLVIPDDITTIKDYTFAYCKSLTSVKISNSVTSIEGCAFKGCSNLTSVIIGENVANIEYDAFADCTSLKYLHIENGTEMLCLSQNLNSNYKVGEGLFFDCPLETLYIGRNLDYNISSNCGYSPFYNKKTLKSVIIGNSVTSIKINAFKNCDMITGIYLLGTAPPAVGNNNFTNSQYMNLTVYVPKGSLATYQSADVWKNFWDIQEFDATGIEGVNANDIAIEVTANGITLSDADGKTVEIYSANGTRVANIDSYVGEEITLDRGVYIVRVGSNTLKVKL